MCIYVFLAEIKFDRTINNHNGNQTQLSEFIGKLIGKIASAIVCMFEKCLHVWLNQVVCSSRSIFSGSQTILTNKVIKWFYARLNSCGA